MQALTSNSWRLVVNLGWMVTEQVLALGLPRLILFPLCERYMGAVDFGQFVFALGLVNMFGMALLKGLTNSVYREYGALPENKREVVLRTALYMGTGVFATLMIFAIAVCVGARFSTGNDIWTWVALLVPGIIAQNIMQLGLIDHSIMRRFDLRAAWMGLVGLGVFLTLPSIVLFGNQHASTGYSLGIVIPLCVLLVARRKSFLKPPRFDGSLAALLSRSWILLWLQVLMDQGCRYAHRTLLGVWSPYEDVGRFFSAMSLIDIFVMPLTMVGSLLMALMAGHVSLATLPRRLLLFYTGCAVACAVLFTVFIHSWGPMILAFLYPRLAQEASSALLIMAPGAGMLALTVVARPFVLKFSSLISVPMLSALALTSHVVPGLLLIPTRGLEGAALSFCIGTCITGIAWFGFFVVMIFKSRPVGSE